MNAAAPSPLRSGRRARSALVATLVLVVVAIVLRENNDAPPSSVAGWRAASLAERDVHRRRIEPTTSDVDRSRATPAANVRSAPSDDECFPELLIHECTCGWTTLAARNAWPTNVSLSELRRCDTATPAVSCATPVGNKQRHYLPAPHYFHAVRTRSARCRRRARAAALSSSSTLSLLPPPPSSSSLPPPSSLHAAQQHWTPMFDAGEHLLRSFARSGRLHAVSLLPGSSSSQHAGDVLADRSTACREGNPNTRQFCIGSKIAAFPHLLTPLKCVLIIAEKTLQLIANSTQAWRERRRATTTTTTTATDDGVFEQLTALSVFSPLAESPLRTSSGNHSVVDHFNDQCLSQYTPPTSSGVAAHSASQRCEALGGVHCVADVVGALRALDASSRQLAAADAGRFPNLSASSAALLYDLALRRDERACYWCHVWLVGTLVDRLLFHSLADDQARFIAHSLRVLPAASARRSAAGGRVFDGAGGDGADGPTNATAVVGMHAHLLDLSSASGDAAGCGTMTSSTHALEACVARVFARLHDSDSTSDLPVSDERAYAASDADENEPLVISVHVRHGDACVRKSADPWGDWGDDTLEGPFKRKCFDLEHYIEGVEWIDSFYARRHDAPRAVVLIASDDSAVLQQLLDTDRRTPFGRRLDAFHFVFLDYSRQVFEQFSSDSRHDAPRSDGWMEVRMAKSAKSGKSRIAHKDMLLKTIVGDLWLLRHADALVATLMSTPAKAILQQIVRRRGIVPPYISLDYSAFGMRERRRDLRSPDRLLRRTLHRQWRTSEANNADSPSAAWAKEFRGG